MKILGWTMWIGLCIAFPPLIAVTVGFYALLFIFGGD